MKKSRKQQEIEARIAADPIARLMERDDVDYSTDELPTAPRSDLYPGKYREIPIEPHVDEPVATGKVIGWTDDPQRDCPSCHLPIGLKEDECTGWHPGFKCECGFDAGTHGSEYRFCPMCSKPRLTEIFNDGIIQGRI